MARALSSPTSAEDRSSLFGWFIDTMARSDSSRACMSAVWLSAFADRPRALAGRGAPEVSRFSCMLFLGVRGFLDYAGPTARSRFITNSCSAFLHQERVGVLIFRFSKLNHPSHRYPCLRFERHLAMPPRKTRGQDGVAVSFPVGLFHSLQHAGLSRRTLINGVESMGRRNTSRSLSPGFSKPKFARET